MLKSYFLRKLWYPVLRYLKMGLTPRKLALTFALGVVFGLFPVVGVTSILCFVIAIALKLNMAVIQVVNYFVYPIQLITFYPMIQFGTYVFGGKEIPDLTYFTDDFIRALSSLGVNILMGIMIWILLAIPLFFITYYLVYFALKKNQVSGH